jgi:hypothetical protein
MCTFFLTAEVSPLHYLLDPIYVVDIDAMISSYLIHKFHHSTLFSLVVVINIGDPMMFRAESAQEGVRDEIACVSLSTWNNVSLIGLVWSRWLTLTFPSLALCQLVPLRPAYSEKRLGFGVKTTMVSVWYLSLRVRTVHIMLISKKSSLHHMMSAFSWREDLSVSEKLQKGI